MSVRWACAVSTLSLYSIGEYRRPSSRPNGISRFLSVMNSQTSLLPERMLTVLREDILPMTQAGVREGNKVFGAAVLRKASLELVVAGTNEEARNSLLHGEISCLNHSWSLPGESRPTPTDCLFSRATSRARCVFSAIAWIVFDNFTTCSHTNTQGTHSRFRTISPSSPSSAAAHCLDGAYASAHRCWNSYYLADLVGQVSQDERAKWQPQIVDLRRSPEPTGAYWWSPGGEARVLTH